MERERTSRRDFLATAAAIGTPLLVSPRTAFGSEASRRLTLGCIGTGGRGTWIADLFQKHGGYEIRAAADYFQDKVDTFGDKFQVAPERRFVGLAGYGLAISERVPIEMQPSDASRRYLKTKKEKLGHILRSV